MPLLLYFERVLGKGEKMAKIESGMSVKPPKMMTSGNHKIGRGGKIKLQTDMKVMPLKGGSKR